MNPLESKKKHPSPRFDLGELVLVFGKSVPHHRDMGTRVSTLIERPVTPFRKIETAAMSGYADKRVDRIPDS